LCRTIETVPRCIGLPVLRRCSSLDSPEAEAIAERYAMPLGQQMLEPPAPRNGKVSRRSNATVIYAKELRRALATS